MRSRRIAVLSVFAAGALAAAPSSGQAATVAPPDACFESPQVAICTSDVGPFAQQTLNDPFGTAQLLVAVAKNAVCYGHDDICSAISTG